MTDYYYVDHAEGDVIADIGPHVGVPSLYSAQDIVSDSTLNTRQNIVPSARWKLWNAWEEPVRLVPAQNRIHHRFVLAADGPRGSLDHFSSPLELVVVMQDAVKGQSDVFVFGTYADGWVQG